MNLEDTKKAIDRTAFAGGVGFTAFFALVADLTVGDPFLGMAVVLAIVLLTDWTG